MIHANKKQDQSSSFLFFNFPLYFLAPNLLEILTN